jgi:hypothetical protein
MNSSTNQKLIDIDKKITALRKRLAREVILTTVLGLLMMAAVCFYFFYGYREISELLKPKMLVDYAATMAQDEVPKLRSMLTSEIESNAPAWAAELSNQVVGAIPNARGQLEDFITGQVDQATVQTMQLTAPEVEKFIEANRADLSRAINELKNADKVLSEESLTNIENALNESLQTNVKKHAEEALQTLSEMKRKGDNLKDGGKLNEMDQRLREIIMILRRFHARELGA